MKVKELLEGWSDKYKRSINCNNPKGFSQRAHCQGRKKNEDADLDERKKKRKKPKSAAYGPGPYGWYGYYSGYSGEVGSGEGGGIEENFADGKIKGKSRPGRVKRAGASCDGSVTDLRSRAKNASGEKAKMYHWCANMKSGRSKK